MLSSRELKHLREGLPFGEWRLPLPQREVDSPLPPLPLREVDLRRSWEVDLRRRRRDALSASFRFEETHPIQDGFLPPPFISLGVLHASA